MSEKNNTIAEKTAALNEIVAWFDSDEFELEKALEMFKKAETVAAEIEHDLMVLKNNIDVVKTKLSE